MPSFWVAFASLIFSESQERHSMAYAGGFGEYLAIKRSKVQDQNSELINNPSLPKIFAGLTLYFDGYTALTMIEFKELVIQRGAIVKDYLASDTTHIIADQVFFSLVLLVFDDGCENTTNHQTRRKIQLVTSIHGSQSITSLDRL